MLSLSHLRVSKVDSTEVEIEDSILWARSVLWDKIQRAMNICDNVKLFDKDKYVDMRRLIVKKMFLTSKLLKYSNSVLESLILLQAD